MGETSGLSLINIIAAPFQYTRKNRLKKNEIIYLLAFGMKWMNMEQANILLKSALDVGIVGYDGEIVTPNFDIQSVANPFGFKSTQSVFLKKYDPVRALKSALDEYLVLYAGEHVIPK
jgi:hypothetical protein